MFDRRAGEEDNRFGGEDALPASPRRRGRGRAIYLFGAATCVMAMAMSAPASAQAFDTASLDAPPLNAAPFGDALPTFDPANVLQDAVENRMTAPALIAQQDMGQQTPPTAEPAPVYGPPAAEPAPPESRDQRYSTFGSRVGAVKWETAAIFAVLTAANIGKVIEDPQGFKFQSEGLFGKDTPDIGVDKLAHSYNTYLFSEILYRRMSRKTGGGAPSAWTAAFLGSALQTYGEFYDAFHEGSGFSWEDFGFNVAGATFSAVRNSVPGLAEKLDFRIEIVPNEDFYTFQGKKHFEQERFHLVLKLSGFEGIRRTPLRFLELHAGYYATDFDLEDRAAGIEPKRKPFVGISLNFSELLFGHSPTGLAGAGAAVLEYLQPPYTTAKVNFTN